MVHDLEKRTGADHLIREDGRIERLCSHGVGHPVGHIRGHIAHRWEWIHGCDGCCSKWP